MSVCNFSECQACPVKVKKTGEARWTDRLEIIHGVGQTDEPALMIVIDGPFKEDAGMGAYLVDGPSTQIERLLSVAGIPMDDVFIVGATRCYSSWDPVVKELDACKPNLTQDITSIKPRIIVPMGSKALLAITGKLKISEQRGSKVETEWGVPCVPTYSPASIFHAPANERAIVNDLQKAYRIAYGDEVTELGEYKTLLTLEEIRKLRNRLLDSEQFAFDFETTSLNPRMASSNCQCCHSLKIICASFSYESGTGFTVPLYGQFCESIWTDEERKEIEDILREILQSDIYKIAANGKFDIEWAYYYLGIDVGYDFDVQYGFAVVHEERPHSLEHQRTLHTNMPRYEAFKDEPEIKALIKEHGYAGIPVELLWMYAAADADLTYRSFLAVVKWMAKDSYHQKSVLNKKYKGKI